MECIFCKIVQKDIPAQIIHEDEYCLAFDDLRPQAPIHKLIIPRKHIATLNNTSTNDGPILGHLLQTAQQLANSLGIAEEGYRIVNNCNARAGQTVFHLHFHLLGGRDMHWPPG